MDLSVIIPTHGRSAKAAACVQALTRQTLASDRFEVILALDGVDPATVEAVTRVWDGPDDQLVIDVTPHSGPSAVRNRAVARARGRSLLFLNDDVVPSPTLAQVHADEQAEAFQRGRPAMIVGSAPWKRRQPDTLFDRLLRETSMVFFYDRMDGPASLGDPMRDWGFRHAWTLNLSVPTDLVRDAGGFTVFPQPFYGYEDVELAFRLSEASATPVLYRPAARVEHDHPMTLAQYLRREYTLGHEAITVARLRPRCARAVFGREVGAPEEIAYARLFVEREERAVRQLHGSLLQASALPASAGDGLHGALLVRTLYEQHLPLKRWFWRRGLLDAAEGRALDCPAWADADHPHAAAA